MGGREQPSIVQTSKKVRSEQKTQTKAPVLKTSSNNSVKVNNSQKATLPQTGEDDQAKTGLLGSLLGILSLTTLLGVKKKKKE